MKHAKHILCFQRPYDFNKGFLIYRGHKRCHATQLIAYFEFYYLWDCHRVSVNEIRT